jgi:hypothetical protein
MELQKIIDIFAIILNRNMFKRELTQKYFHKNGVKLCLDKIMGKGGDPDNYLRFQKCS